MAEHTPEPWTVDAAVDAHGFYTIRRADGSEHGDTVHAPIATVFLKEDATVIAASVELAVVLRDLLSGGACNYHGDCRVHAERARILLARLGL